MRTRLTCFWRRPTGAIALVLAVASPAGVPGVAGATRTAAMFGAYNAERSANGLPTVSTINPAMEQGCADHDRYMFLNHSLAHGEDPGKPGYTPQGNYQDGAQGGEVLAEASGWSSTYEPWTTAPIHLYPLFDPSVAQIGYADLDGFQCLRMRGSDTPPPAGYVAPPAFYAWTSDHGPKYVSPSEHAAEYPYTPQQLLGIPPGQTTGPNILLFSAADRATPEQARLTGPNGDVAVGLVNANTQNAIGDGRWFLGGGVLIPTQPLMPMTAYTATIDWHDPAITSDNGLFVQQFSFTTTHRPATLTMRLRADRRGRWRVIVTGTPKAAVALSGPDGVTLHPRMRGNRTAWLNLKPHGLWNACDSSADLEYPATGTCQQLNADGPPAAVQ